MPGPAWPWAGPSLRGRGLVAEEHGQEKAGLDLAALEGLAFFYFLEQR